MASDDNPAVTTVTCYEASAGCLCSREDCGGVQEFLTSCPVHGVDGPDVLRVHGCKRDSSVRRARMMASRRPSGS